MSGRKTVIDRGGAHEPDGRHQSRKAAASGWIGSALEYYDFFIYATAASLVFPQLFFPSGDPTAAIVASLATYGAAYAVQAVYGVGFAPDVYLWIPVVGNIVAVLVIPFVGNLSDRIGRRPPIIVGALVSGLLSFGYLYAISIHSIPLAVAMSLLMWGVVYQGYNATFPSFYPELFQTRMRVTAMAIAQNVGTTITALLPALFAAVAPPGAPDIPLTVGAITFGITVIVAVAALSARETYRLHLRDLGHRGTQPVPRAEYDAMRAQSLAAAAAMR